jgi:hypothetical protein
MILYLKDQKYYSKKFLDTIHSFIVAGYKINFQKSVAFLSNNSEQIEKEYKKTIPSIIASKNQMHRNKLNKRCE